MIRWCSSILVLAAVAGLAVEGVGQISTHCSNGNGACCGQDLRPRAADADIPAGDNCCRHSSEPREDSRGQPSPCQPCCSECGCTENVAAPLLCSVTLSPLVLHGSWSTSDFIFPQVSAGSIFRPPRAVGF